MAFHNTYNKELVVEEYKKRFQQILEYTSAGGFDLSEADDEQAADEQPMGDNSMGSEQMPDMGSEQPMGGDTQDPNMMGGDPNTMGGMDTMQPDDEVVDITELTDAQEATQEELESFDSKFTKAIKAIEKIEAMINTNNKNIADKISEIEVEMKKRNPTPMEKLSNRAANSYPFNVNPKEYWDDKEKNSNYSADDDNNGKGQEQYTITAGDINNANDWKTISDSLDDDLLYNQTLNNILKY